jgi:hypothetical protein
MYYKPDSNQLIEDTTLITDYGLFPGKPEFLIQYGFYYVYDVPLQYDWLTQRLVKGDVKKINGGEFYEFPYTIEDLTEEEIGNNRNQKKTLDWAPIREKRDNLLKESDYTQILDANLVSDEDKILWFKYRQELRDLPEKFDDVSRVVWPKSPKEEKEEAERENMTYPPDNYNVGQRPTLPESVVVGMGTTPSS